MKIETAAYDGNPARAADGTEPEFWTWTIRDAGMYKPRSDPPRYGRTLSEVLAPWQ